MDCKDEKLPLELSNKSYSSVLEMVEDILSEDKDFLEEYILNNLSKTNSLE